MNATILYQDEIVSKFGDISYCSETQFENHFTFMLYT